MFKESPMRSVLKAVSWRIIATLTTALLVYAFTGELGIAVAVGMLEAVTKIVLYYFHERLWNRLTVGRRPIGHHAGGAPDTGLHRRGRNTNDGHADSFRPDPTR